MVMQFDESISEILAQNGKKNSSELLKQLNTLQKQLLEANLTAHDTQKYEKRLEEAKKSLRTSSTRKFRFRMSDLGPESDPDQGQTSTTATVTALHNKWVIKGSYHEQFVNSVFNLQNEDSVHLIGLKHCLVVAKCHQLRLTDCTDSEVYTSTERPVIESCNGLKIGFIRGEPEWIAVDDFQWLKSGPNPHWSKAGTIEPLGAAREVTGEAVDCARLVKR